MMDLFECFDNSALAPQFPILWHWKSWNGQVSSVLNWLEKLNLIWTLEYCIIVILDFSINFYNLILCLLFLVILCFSDCFFFVIADKNSVSFQYFWPKQSLALLLCWVNLGPSLSFCRWVKLTGGGWKKGPGSSRNAKREEKPSFWKISSIEFFPSVSLILTLLTFQYLAPWQLTQQ